MEAEQIIHYGAKGHCSLKQQDRHKALAPIWTTAVRRAGAGHHTTTMFGYIGQARFGWKGEAI
ncbi:hypothetical protein A2U01_0010580, partial [Trifolium medium]|nr:hypothetical protein [Trifolium medium]